MSNKRDSDSEENYLIEGRNPVLEAFRAGMDIDKLFVLEGCRDSAVSNIVRVAKESGTPVIFADKKRLDEMSQTGRHRGVIAKPAAVSYAELDDIFEAAALKDEKPFVFLLDGIEDPHNLGAIIRTAHVCGAHGVIIGKRHSAGITPVVVRTSAGATGHIPVVRVSNIASTIEALKKRGLWFVCASMEGDVVYEQELDCAVGLVIGNEGKGVSQLVKSKCDFITSIPMYGEVASLNASVAAGVLAYEIVRQRRFIQE